MEEETKETTTQTKTKRYKTFDEVYDYDYGLEMDFSDTEDYDLPVLDFCDI